MLSDEEREALQYFNTETKTEAMHYGAVLVKLIEKQSKEIEDNKKYIDLHYVPYEQYTSKLNELNKKWEDKIKAKTIEIKNRQVKDEFITASQGKLNTIIDMESLL